MKKNLLALIVIGLSAGLASAADRYWDADGIAGGNVISGAGLGGTGNWDTTSLNWWDGSGGSDIAWTDGNTAIFSGTAGIVTIPGNNATLANITRSATGLTFNTDGYEISATGTTSTGATARGILTLTGSANVLVPTGIKAKMTTKLSGTVGMNISGGGTFWLAEPDSVAPNFGGLNNMTGNVSVTSGSAVNASTFGTVLEVIGGGQIGNSAASAATDAANAITLNGGTYRNTDPTPTGSSFGFTTGTSRNWVIGTNGGVWDTPIATSIFLNGSSTAGRQAAGSIAVTGVGNHVLYKTGPGEVRMSGPVGQTNDIDQLYISEGRFTIGQATTPGRDEQLGKVPASPAAGAQSVVLNGQASGAILRFAGGNLTGSATVAAPIQLSANRGIYLDNTGGASNTFQVGDAFAEILGAISGPGGFIKTGALSLTLRNTSGNTYAGGTTINAGLLKLLSTNTSTGSRVGNGAVTVAAGAALSLEYDSTIGGNSPQPEAPGGVSVTGTITGNGILSGPLTMNSGGRILPGIGGGNAVLSVPNADLSAGVTLQSTLGNTGSSDVLKVTTASTGLNLSGGTVSLVPVGTTNPAGQSYTVIDYTTGYTGDVNSLLINNLTGFEGTVLQDDPANHRIKAVIGTVVTERTWVREFDFGLWNNDAPPAGETANWAKPDNTTPAAAANGVGAIAHFPTVSPITSNPIPTQTVTLSENKTLGTLDLDNPNSFTFTPGIAGVRLTMQTYTGNALIDVKKGTHVFNTGVTLTSATTINLAASTSLTFNVNATSNAAGLTVNGAAGSTFITAPVTNTGGFTKTGSGLMIIRTNDWTGTGATNINGGTLQYTSDNAPGLGNGSVVTVATGATVDLNSGGAQIIGVGGAVSALGVSDTIGALAGGGSWLNGRNLTVGGTAAAPVNASGNFSGTLGISSALGGNDYMVTGGGSAATRAFAKNGGGTQTFSGIFEATGNFNAASSVTGGTLILNNTAGSLMTNTAAAILTVSSGATLGGTGNLLGSVTINSGGILSPGSGGVGTIHLQNTTAPAALTLPAGALMSFDIGTGGADMIDMVAGLLSVATSTTTKINLVQSGTITAGTYTLIDYGTIGGTGGFAGLSLGSQPSGFSYNLFNDTTAGAVKLTITLASIPGDFNNDGKVDAADYVSLRKLTPDITTGTGLTNYTTWRTNFGTGTGSGSGDGLGNTAVPEPSTIALIGLGLVALVGSRRRVG